MKDYVFSKQIPFKTERSENSNSMSHKYLARGFAALFANDQRVFLAFVIGLAIPGLICAFIGLILTSIGHPILMFFDFLLVCFIGWVFWMLHDMYTRLNIRLAKDSN